LALHVTVLPLIIIRDFSGTFTDVGFVASVAALLEAPCMIAWGYAAMRMRKETILAANAILYALYLALFLVARSVMDVLYLQVLNAIATAALLSLTISYMQDTIKGRVGLSTSLMDVVTVVSAMSASAVFALFAGENAYVQVFAVGAVLSLAGGVLMGVSRRLVVPDTSDTVT
jgi:predicted MFS family arabinose efflux permease